MNHGFGIHALALATVVAPPATPGGDLTINGSDTFAAFSDSGALSIASSIAGSDTFAAFADSGSVMLLNTLEISHTTGSDTYTTGAYVIDTLAECTGGGAGGITATRAGGGGAHAHSVVAVSPSTGYPRVAGAGGAAGGTAGGNSTFDSGVVAAEGGGQTGTASDGGRASASTGTVKFDGGAGVVGAGNSAGGGSAGFAGAASGATPGAPDGATGRSSAGSGTTCRPGAGGRSTASSQVAGAAGRVRNTTRIPSDGTVPEIVDTGTYRAATSTTHDISGAIPASVQVGDRVRVWLGISAAPSVTFTDWTQIVLQANGTALTGAIYERVWTGTENTTITLGSSQALNAYVRVERNSQAATATAATGTSTSADCPNHSPGSGTYRWDAFAVFPSANAATATPSGYDGVGALPPLSVVAASIQMILLWRVATASSEDPGAYTIGSADWVAITASSKR